MVSHIDMELIKILNFVYLHFRLKSGNYYQPNHNHMKFEMEDSILDDGSPVAYGFSQAEFPRFSWKGYVAVGHEQVCMLHVFLCCVRFKTARSCHLSVLRINQNEEFATKRVFGVTICHNNVVGK